VGVAGGESLLFKKNREKKRVNFGRRAVENWGRWQSRPESDKGSNEAAQRNQKQFLVRPPPKRKRVPQWEEIEVDVPVKVRLGRVLAGSKKEWRKGVIVIGTEGGEEESSRSKSTQSG